MRLTGNDRKASILEFIRSYVERHGYPPSIREIGAAVGLRSTASVARYLTALQDMGQLSHPPTKRRAWSLTRDDRERSASVPLIGRITAGVPILAVESQEDRLTLSTTLFSSPPDYLLRVQGESMIEAGIRDGDLVAVETTGTVKNGDIVIAMIGDEATVKYFERLPDAIRLNPANPRFEPITSPDIEIIGRVVGLMRSY